MHAFQINLEKSHATHINIATPQWHTQELPTGTCAESVVLLNMHISVIFEFVQEQ